MASKVKRDFEGPLKHLLVGTYDLKVKIEGRWVYLMVVLDAYSRAMLQLHTTFDNSESEVIRLADKIAGMLEKPATIYFVSVVAQIIRSTRSTLSLTLCSRLLNQAHILAIT